MVAQNELGHDYVHDEHPFRGSTELSRFLADIPASKSALEYLVIERWGRWKTRAAWIVEPEETGLFRLEASFGTFDHAAFESDPLSIWGDHPLAVALMSTNGFTTTAAYAPLLRSFLTDTDATGLAIQPIRPNNQERFVIAVACVDGEENASGCLEDMVTDSPLIGLYLSFLQKRRSLAADGAWSRKEAEPSQSLTARQSTILQLLSDGMKNREIAFAIGFSESTVRLETIEIYKKLGVQGRHEAVRVAVRLGLLED